MIDLTYLVGPLVVVVCSFLVVCLKAAMMEDYNMPEWMRHIGVVVWISLWGIGICSIAMLGHFLITGE